MEIVIRWAIRQWRAVQRYWNDRVIIWVATLLSFRRVKNSYIISEELGEVALDGAKDICVFNHWDKKGNVHAYVRHYLAMLKDSGFAIVFVTNSEKLTPAALATLKPLCAKIIIRENVGYDFGAYKEGVLSIPDLESRERLLFANDSVYGPLFPLAEVFEAADSATADAWAVTDSWEMAYHLQSYFLLLHKPAFTQERFMKFWRGMRYLGIKRAVILKYEIGLTRMLLNQGLRCQAVCPYEQAIEAMIDTILEKDLLEKDGKLDEYRRLYLGNIFAAGMTGEPLNPMHFLWDFLILKMRCPFIKRELLIKNPGKVPMLNYWDRVVAEVSDYDVSLVKHHLKQSVRKRAV